MKNYCEPVFRCTEPERKKCIYFAKEDGNDDCKYMDGSYCDSKVAQVNVMTVTLKRELKQE